MKKIKLIFLVIIISIFIGCYDAPPRETQGLEYNSIDELINTSDRILELKKLDKEKNEKVQLTTTILLHYLCLMKMAT